MDLMWDSVSSHMEDKIFILVDDCLDVNSSA